MKTLKQLLDDRSAKQTELDTILDAAKKEGRDIKTLNDDEAARADKLFDDIEALDGEIAKKREQSGEARSGRMQSVEGRRVTNSVAPARGPEVPTDRQQAEDPVENPDSRQYSLLRAIRCRIENRPVDGYEGEISQEIAHRTGRQAQGFFVPMNLGLRDERPGERRAFDTSAGTGGLQVSVSPTIVQALRNEPILARMGARVMSGMVGTFDLPKKTGTSTAYWVGEGSDVTGSAPALGQIEFTPSTLGGYTDITRRLANQVSFDAELEIRNDLKDTLVIELDRAGINGSGASNQPTGILQDSDVTTVAIDTNGGAPTHAKIVALESTVAVANGASGQLAYLTSCLGRGKLKTTEKGSAGYPVYLWSDGNEMNGYPAFATNQVPSNLTKNAGSSLTAVIFGDFAQCIFAFWTGFDLIVDPFSLSKSGGIRIVSLVDCTFKLRQPAKLAKIVDMTR